MTRNSALFLATFVLSVLLLFRAADAVWHSFRARHWPVVDAVITASDTGWAEHRRANYRPLLSYELHVRYAYRVGVKGYMGSQVRFSPWGVNENFNPFMLNVVRRYPVGTLVRAHFDPDNPSDSVLEAQLLMADWIFLIAGLASAMLCLCFMRRVEAEKTKAGQIVSTA